MTKDKTEQELAEKLVAWLEGRGWEVWQEVPTLGGFADIVAVQKGIVWMIEVKKSLTLSLLEQIKARNGAHRFSIAVKAPQRDHKIATILLIRDYFQAGLIYISNTFDYYGEGDDYSCREVVNAPLHRHYHRFAKRTLEKLNEMPKDYCKAGSQHGARFTAYKASIEKVRVLLSDGKPRTAREIISHLGNLHYSGRASALSALGNALEGFERDWCEIINPESQTNRLFSIRKQPNCRTEGSEDKVNGVEK